MSKKSHAAQPPKFDDMSVVNKLTHVAKICVFFLTFGFAFPNILGD